MVSVYQLKPAFQALLRPLVAVLARAGVTANQITLSAILLSAMVGYAIGCGPSASYLLLLLPMALLVRMGLNAIDGMLAREYHQASRLGAILNELGDVISDAAIYLPLALRAEFPAPLIVIVVTLSVMVEMTGVIGIQIGASRRYDGPMGKSDRAFVFGALGLLLGVGLPGGIWLSWAFIAVALLCAWTVVNRARAALAESQK